jgi:hypothetical protein
VRRACARKLFLRQLRVTTDLLSPSATVASKPGGPPLTFRLSRSARLREPRSQPFRGSHPFVLDGQRPHLFIGGGSLRWPRYSYTSAIHFWRHRSGCCSTLRLTMGLSRRCPGADHSSSTSPS